MVAINIGILIRQDLTLFAQTTATNPDKAAAKTKLTSKERPVVDKISGKGEALTGKAWLSLSV